MFRYFYGVCTQGSLDTRLSVIELGQIIVLFLHLEDPPQHTDYHSGYTSLLSYQQWIRAYSSCPNPLQLLLISLIITKEDYCGIFIHCVKVHCCCWYNKMLTSQWVGRRYRWDFWGQEGLWEEEWGRQPDEMPHGRMSVNINGLI